MGVDRNIIPYRMLRQSLRMFFTEDFSMTMVFNRDLALCLLDSLRVHCYWGNCDLPNVHAFLFNLSRPLG